MTDHEREERAIWKLEQATSPLNAVAGRYLVINDGWMEKFDGLASLVKFANRLYDLVWTRR